MDKLTPSSPCEVTIVPDECGGVTVTLMVPTYSGGIVFTMTAERDSDSPADSEWRVFMPAWPKDCMANIPWPTEDEPDAFLNVSNGIVYLGAPDVPVERKRVAASPLESPLPRTKHGVPARPPDHLRQRLHQ